MATQFNENVIFSINALIVKNAEYARQIQNILHGVESKSLDYEKYFIETEFGNKIIKASVAAPDVTLIALNNVRDLAHRIKENNVMIRRLAKSQPAYSMTSEEITAAIAWLQIQEAEAGPG